MNSTVAVLEEVVSGLDKVLSTDALAEMSDAERADVLRVAGAAFRRVEAVLVETVATAKADAPARLGCRSVNELIQRAVRVDAPGAAKVVKAAGLIHRDTELTSGERLPARWPALRQAMLDGAVGIAGMLAATGPIEQAGDRIGAGDRLMADELLADHARGSRPADALDPEADAADAAPAATPDDLRMLAQEIAIVLDPDGAEPTDRNTAHQRSLTIGRQRDGLYPIRGNLLPDVYAQLQLLLDAQLNPKVDGPPAPGVAFRPSDDHEACEDGEACEDDDEARGCGDDAPDPFNADPRAVIDPRTRAQKQHDALAAALGIAARHEDMPSLGGAAPTLVVQVEAADYAAGRGWARLPGVDMPVSPAVTHQTACIGTVQRVLFDAGRIIGITVTDRVFTVHQRRAIVNRDRECLIPGCHVPASWCEIHHVTEHARGGPTSTDNGVPLCWWHHRSLDYSGWEIRMNDGLPEIRGPAWWDPLQRWRTPRPSIKRVALRS